MTSDEPMVGPQKLKEDEKVSTNMRRLSGFWYWVGIIFPIIVIKLAIIRVFDLRFFIGYMMNDMTYYYIVLGLLLSLGFIQYPPITGLSDRNAIRSFWVDAIIFFFVIVSCFYFAWVGLDVITKGWGATSPVYAAITAGIIWLLIIEAVRRSSGLILALVILVFSFYPLYANRMPGIFFGFDMSFLETAQYHIFGKDSALGVLMTIYADIILGFIFFWCCRYSHWRRRIYARSISVISRASKGRYRQGCYGFKCYVWFG